MGEVRGTETLVSEDELATRALGPVVATPDLEPGTAVARYVIVERIGMGGMGTVYLAYDPRLNRRVALKILRGGGVESGGTNAARLVREAQALAQLSSRYVVQVYEVSTAPIEGRGEVLFLAMEFAEGTTLRRWWRDRRPGWRELVGVMLDAGQGLVDAHGVGLVHRDFKPANVLVSADGRVRVVDFGLAKVAPDGLRMSSDDEPLRRVSRDSDSGFVPAPLSSMAEQLTEFGTVMGTPAYMAPEQHMGEVGDERSDQYGFCVTLFEALYGTRPFAGAARKELLAQKHALQISAPQQVRSVPARLRKIILRGLSPDPAKRWPDMATLLEQLVRLLGRRRRVGIAAGSAAVVGIAAAAALSGAGSQACADTAQAIDATWSAQRRDDVALAFLASGTTLAESTWTHTEAALDQYAQAWRDGRREACLAHRSGAQSDALLDRRMTCLDDARTNLHGLVDTFAEADVETIINAFKAISGLPRIARCADAESMLADVAPPADAELAARVAELRALIAVSRARVEAGKLDEALDGAREVVALAEQTSYAPVQAEALLLLGRAEGYMDLDVDSERSLDRAFRIGIASGHDRVALQAGLHQTHVIGHKLHRPVEALARRSMLEALLERTDAGPDERARANEAIATALRSANEFGEAQALLLASIEIRRSRADVEPMALSTALNNYGNLLRDLERFDDANAAFDESIAIAEGVLGPDHPGIASTLSNKVNVYVDQSRGADAVVAAERAWKIYDTVLGPTHVATAESLGKLAGARWISGAKDRAVEELGAALSVLERERGPEHPATVTALSNYGALLSYVKRYDEGRATLQRALKVAEADPNRRNGDVSFLSVLLGDIAASTGDPAEARRCYARAVAYIEEHHGVDSFAMAMPLQSLARLSQSEGQFDDALAKLTRSRELMAAKGAGAVKLAAIDADLAELLAQKGSVAEAIDAFAIVEAKLASLVAAGDNSARAREQLEAVREAVTELRARSPTPTHDEQ